jgi:hypothetical protein
MKPRQPLAGLSPKALSREPTPIQPLSARQSLVAPFGRLAGQTPSSTAGKVRSIDPGQIGMFEYERRRDPFFDERTYRNNKAREQRRLFPKVKIDKVTVSKEKLDEMMAFIRDNL